MNLRGMTEVIEQRLKELGVAEERMPTTSAIVDHVWECVDEEKLNRWLEAFAKVENK